MGTIAMPNVRSGWVAYLSDGSCLAESDFLAGPGLGSPWVQLRDMVNNDPAGRHLIGLELFFANQRVKCPSGAEAYWQSRAAFSTMNSPYGMIAQGVGVVWNGQIVVYWINEKGQITSEVRDLDPADPRIIRGVGPKAKGDNDIPETIGANL